MSLDETPSGSPQESNGPLRSRRKLNRVNYAEDSLSIEKILADNDSPKSKTARKASTTSGATSTSTSGKAVATVNDLSPEDSLTVSVKAKFLMNWQRKLSPTERLSNAMDFIGATLKDGQLHLVDGTVLKPDDHVYILSEPPGEPYYIGRIMEFGTKEQKDQILEPGSVKNEDVEMADTEEAAGEFGGKTSTLKPGVNNRVGRRATRTASGLADAADIYQVRVNWLYRPKDISNHTSDSRLLFATMHSDWCPLHGLRGKCTVSLKDHIDDIDKYRSTPNSFYFEKLYDRYIVKYFDIVPTEKITNIPLKLRSVLSKKFKYAVVESGRGKELCDTPKSCEKCSQWCASDDAVQCAHCSKYYHMFCLDPPIFRKPTRGFGWSCAACSKALEEKLQESKGLEVNRRGKSEEAEEAEEGEDAHDTAASEEAPDAPSKESDDTITEKLSSDSDSSPTNTYERLERALELDGEATPEQLRQQKMWPFRYLGQHSKMEDILAFDDRIYPKAGSRLGNKHQHPVKDWPGQPVIYFEAQTYQPKTKKKGIKSGARISSTETTGAADSSTVSTGESNGNGKRPPWVQPRPPGYIERGNDNTSTLNWKSPEDHWERIDAFLEKTKPYAAKINMAHNSANFIDAALKAFMDSNYQEAPALQVVSTFTRKSLKEPTFDENEKQRFEDGVRKYGNELHLVYKEIGTKTAADVVRYYYLWKKTPFGHEIWGNYEGRRNAKKGKSKQEQINSNGLPDEIADSADDSAYDAEKAKNLKRSFVCKFCHTVAAREWRRAPGYPVATETDPVVALCIRCARLWRRYAVIWEEPDEILKLVSKKGGYSWKRKIEHELLEDSKAIYAELDKEVERERARRVKAGDTDIAAAPNVTSSSSNFTSNTTSTGASGSVGRGAALAAQLQANAPAANGKRSAFVDSKIKAERPSKKVKVKSFLDAEDNTEMLEAISNKPKSPRKTVATSAGRTKSVARDSPDVSLTSGSTPSLKVPPRGVCAVCKQTGPFEHVLYCEICGLYVHHACYGVDIRDVSPNTPWMCDTCSNDQMPIASTVYGCCLCPVRDNGGTSILGAVGVDETKIEKSSLMDGMKRTLDNNWVHVRCAVFNPKITFESVHHLQRVEGVSNMSKSRLDATCVLCRTISGACISCPECKDKFHVGCATKVGYYAGFKFTAIDSAVKSEKPDSDSTTVELDGKLGTLEAVVVCSEHERAILNIYRPAYIDKKSNRSVLQLYCEKYKRSEISDTGAKKKASYFRLASLDSDDDNKTLQGLLADNRGKDGSPLEPPLALKEFVIPLDRSKDFSKHAFYSAITSCDQCKAHTSSYWFKDEQEKMKCVHCYWKDKDMAMYNKYFQSQEKINILDDKTEVTSLNSILNPM